MNTLKIVGLLLIVVGIAALVFQGFTYTTREKIIDLGPIEATTEQKRTIPLQPALGVIALIGGIILLVAGSRKP